ncbi:branched-chain amino acid ABC transporter ATP-binding protein/permease [Amycolatopsis sp.]|uniref:branched-chain amino acid ABC transporter ATP-binding protein/permease n=1 Tax=Amycolatopsis sp. TaxID=37632 RepID=UPI002BF74FC1|nr:branched-chain amino acid ABC transporter ATP-binding protein/permease [Amycolatopsis sp.]HVV10473.1 branched-chain amino acid ABC transporter ATP-binding protein/permease [Amycolatopsis sp.]
MGVFAIVRRLPTWALPLVAAVLVILFPVMGLDSTVQRQVMLICILALLVSGLNLSLGYAGELALGQAAIYAGGAYVSGYLGAHGHTDLLLQLVAAGVVALLLGLLTGIPGLRLGNWALAMVSFFLVLLVPDVLDMFQSQTGGTLGLAGIEPVTLFGIELDDQAFYVTVTVVTALWLLILRNLVTSRHGTAFRVLRESPVLAASIGISVFRMKLSAYAVAALPAGIAGCLFANVDHYLAPDSFGFSLAVSVLAASILGGSASVYGAVIGAAILQLGPLQATSFQQYALVVYGLLLLVGGIVLSVGIAGLARKLWSRVERRWAPRGRSVTYTGEQLPAIDGARLSVRHLAKTFGGVKALQDVSLEAKPGQVTALIGPNGSGKTTLLNMICGYYRLDAGEIRLGEAGSSRSPFRVARAGIARTFQTPSVPPGITVAEAVRSGRYATQHASFLSAIFRLPGYRRARAADIEEARRVLALVGLEEFENDEAASLPLGTRRLLEVARSLVSRPRVLLLDEAASGLDEDEVDRLADLIRRIRDSGGTVVLVEHNFRLVLSLADHIHVLARGRIIASGPPAEIEVHPEVLTEYLGMPVSGAGELLATAGAEAGQDD